jgi:RimJ/RimL family protein N-acetyltransferase
MAAILANKQSHKLPDGGFSIGFRDPASDADFAMLLEHRNDPRVRLWLGDDRLVTPEQNRAFWASPAAQHYRIATHGPDNSDVGLIRVSLHDEGREAAVGCDVFVRDQGRGLGHLVFDRACANAIALGARRLWLKVFLGNTRAVKIYLRAGFEFTGEVESMSVRPTISTRYSLRYATMEKRVP